MALIAASRAEGGLVMVQWPRIRQKFTFLEGGLKNKKNPKNPENLEMKIIQKEGSQITVYHH